MRVNESSLWRWIQKNLPSDCMFCRVENVVSRGTPDVFGVRNGRAVAIELKSVPRRKSGNVWCELKPEQASFLRRWHAAGGIALVIVQVSGQNKPTARYAVTAQDCHMLLHLMSENLLRDVSREVFNSFFKYI